MVNTVSRMRQWYSHPPLTPILSLSAKCQIQLSSNHTCMEKTRYIIIIIIIIIVNDIWNKSYMNCGNNPVEVLNFFQASSRNCINCVHCDNFSLLLLLLRVRAFLETFFFIKLSFFFIVAVRTQCQKGYQNFIPTLYGCSTFVIKDYYTLAAWKKKSCFLDFTNKRHLRYVS